MIWSHLQNPFSCIVRAEMCDFWPERCRFAGVTDGNQHRSGKKLAILA